MLCDVPETDGFWGKAALQPVGLCLQAHESFLLVEIATCKSGQGGMFLFDDVDCFFLQQCLL